MGKEGSRRRQRRRVNLRDCIAEIKFRQPYVRTADMAPSETPSN